MFLYIIIKLILDLLYIMIYNVIRNRENKKPPGSPQTRTAPIKRKAGILYDNFNNESRVERNRNKI